ncbi:hypothetical protein [Streptococcus halichoeri]|uniref:hypothetical protein n=1 Tax=Streptococcus halichoeri TaxID=254785 RepID=UPI0013573DE0|nr:hypothetical protein [Streptococcus halichoeri]
MKKLLMVMAMCLAFCAVAVNAEGRKWEKVPDQQKVTDDGGNEIPVSIENGDKITVMLPPGWSVWFEKNGQLCNLPESVKGNNKPYKILDKPQSIYNGNAGLSGLSVSLTLDPPSTKGDKLAVSFQGGGFYAGSVYLWDSETITEAKQKAEGEKLYLEYVNYDNSKTWYQRLGDGIRDQWWNFTGMFY